VRTLVGVLVVLLVLAVLASAAVRGVRRVAWSGGADVVLGVVVVVALVN
jgi:hypothetical protein